MHWLETRIPPLLVMATVSLLMWLMSVVLPDIAIPPTIGFVATLILASAGVLLLIASGSLFAKVRTTVNPLNPEGASTLIVKGIYRWSRNPMYLGCLILLLAWGVFLENLFAACVAFTFVAYMNRFQIRPEERALESRFGEQYLEYERRIRRWL